MKKKISVLYLISVFLMSCTESSHEVVFSAEEFQLEVERLSEIYNVPVSFNEKEMVPSFANLNRIKNGMELIQRMKNGEFSVIPVSDNEINLFCSLPINPEIRSSVAERSARIGQDDWICSFVLSWTELDVFYSAVEPWETNNGEVICAWIHDGQVDLDTNFELLFGGVHMGRYALYGYYVISTGEDHFTLHQIGT